ncbi:MAG: HlyD family secretion protein [Candidatus Melainabacteria bacterium]|nr:HlyD family secretion protein [Candidatus Melainabacteria bacterium]
MYGQNTLNITDAGSAEPPNPQSVSFSVALSPENANRTPVTAVFERQTSADVYNDLNRTLSTQSSRVLATPQTTTAVSAGTEAAALAVAVVPTGTTPAVATPAVATLPAAPAKADTPDSAVATHSVAIETKTPLDVQTTDSKDNAAHHNEKSNGSSIKKVLIAVFLIGITGYGGVAGYHAFNHFMSHQETEDAYTTGHQHQISTRVNGTVEQVLVDDNQHVKKGQVLAILDPRDYEVRVLQAKAALELSHNQAAAAKTSIVLSSTTATGRSTEAEAGVADSEAAVSRAEAALLEARASIPKAEADLRAKEAEETRAKADGRRFVRLANEGAVSYQQRDGAVRDFEVAKSAREASEELLKQSKFKLTQANQALNMAKAQVNQSRGLVQQANATHVQTKVSEKQFDVATSSIHQAEAQLRDAELQLSYTKIISPVNGRIGKKTVEPGQRIQPGQQLMTIVSDDIWVVANFKETQLERMRPQQLVEIKIDSYPHHNFYGTVDSVSPGSGATFALLPPDNATGNFTKIVQRIPVKIRFDRNSTRGYENLIVPGMSAIVSVDVKGQQKTESSSAVAHDENKISVHEHG